MNDFWLSNPETWEAFLTYPSSPRPSLSPHPHQSDPLTSSADLLKISQIMPVLFFSLPLLQSVPPPFLPGLLKEAPTLGFPNLFLPQTFIYQYMTANKS